MKSSLLVTFFMFCLLVSIGVGPLAQSRSDVQLAGVWKSQAPEDVGNGMYSIRRFTFTEKSWGVEAVFYNDEKLTTPLLSFKAEGPYRLGDASSVVIGARNAVFSFSKKSLTLFSSDPAIIERFNLANCNLVIGVPKDISLSGCSIFTSIAQCAQEYDLVVIENDLLRLGMRPSDRNMCTEDKRPKNLGSPVKRQTVIIHDDDMN
jgi:hypothetical protein